jgi:hypothetical protein
MLVETNIKTETVAALSRNPCKVSATHFDLHVQHLVMPLPPQYHPPVERNLIRRHPQTEHERASGQDRHAHRYIMRLLYKPHNSLAY